jgi:phosphomethylpyrimidine synthase
MTQLQQAKAGVVTPEMKRVAERECVAPEAVRAALAAGRLVIPANRAHLAGKGAPAKLDPCGIGRMLTTKVNANIGASPVSSCKDKELVKLRLAVKFGADAVMDLSTGGDGEAHSGASGGETTLDEIRRHLIANATVPIGTVPMYSMIVGRPIEQLTHETILREVEKQARQGVDFFTIHAGLMREHLPLIRKRTMGIVSRGGSLLAKWMTIHGRQNPMYELFDELCAILREHDVTISLGDGLRPGCLADASDEAQFAELDALGALVRRARAAGVQAIVEGPGHVPLDQIEMNMRREEEVCDGAPFYVLGPVVSDIFPGYDHITSSIGAAWAALHGASFLCYVTPAEHLSLPTPEDVKAGCIAYKIAAHSADVARKLPGARDRDDAMARARADLDWKKQFELAFDGESAKKIRQKDLPDDSDFCSMCGRDWCALRISRDLKNLPAPG